MKIGLFPGQGIPAKVVLAALPGGDSLLETAAEVLGYDLRRKVEIAARRAKSALPTAVVQPAILCAGLINWAALEKDPRQYHYLAGHSLGEYTALVAAGALSPGDGLKAVAVRGEAMQDAARATPGGMAALLGLDFDEATNIADKTGVVVANDNAPGQVVLSGPDEALADAAALARSSGGRAVLLDVSGPFHTDAMAPAVPALERVLEQIEIRDPAIGVVSNVRARPYRNAAEIRELLIAQLTTRVRFRESLEWMISRGAREFDDLGPGRIVSGLAHRTVDHIEKEKETADV